ncbi:(d)CMP kinase [Methanobacterium alcaliphilum]|uniref:(d)CMP kinase n=1 Tax=Methanobacterium alcaliphilum TaxID=392018 RepID=UPI00200A390F|nr:AAA family ATPase [Methanobacterium alcaliphilum]MCK9151338.1 AAA family ATPase [Methanobacterium alcaliphilum]
MIITIGGLAGSGTTTASRILSEKLSIPYVSAGDIFRQMAAESGMDILEFSKFAENNNEIDIEIDQRQAKMAEEAENLIVEGRLSAHFVDANLKIWMIAPFDVRSLRISQRELKPVDLVKKEIQIRETSEAQRYHEIHNIDINNLEIYDLILNTNSFQAESVADIILKVTKVI